MRTGGRIDDTGIGKIGDKEPDQDASYYIGYVIQGHGQCLIPDVVIFMVGIIHHIDQVGEQEGERYDQTGKKKQQYNGADVIPVLLCLYPDILHGFKNLSGEPVQGWRVPFPDRT